MARSTMGKDKVRGYPSGGMADPNIVDQSDLGGDAQGDNRLQGNDQESVRNQRPDMPDEIADRPKGPAQPEHVDRPKDRGTRP